MVSPDYGNFASHPEMESGFSGAERIMHADVFWPYWTTVKTLALERHYT